MKKSSIAMKKSSIAIEIKFHNDETCETFSTNKD